MKITAHTERGVFVGKETEIDEDELLELKNVIRDSIVRGEYLKLDTEKGVIILGEALLKTAVFVIE